MDALQLQSFGKKLKISPVEILREEIEMSILQELSQSSLAKNLIFKGGTALRLCYGSPRFSQDLDFNQRKKFDLAMLKQTLQKIAHKNQEISVKEVFKKRFTKY